MGAAVGLYGKDWHGVVVNLGEERESIQRRRIIFVVTYGSFGAIAGS